jgi:NADH-quinone oxidoreductase subunit N
MELNFQLIRPEIALACLAFLVLALDLIFLRAERKGWLGWLSAAGIIAVLLLLVSQRDVQGDFLRGFLADRFAFTFKVIFLLAAGLCSLASVDFSSRHLRWPGEFFSLILFSTLGFMLMVSAGDFIILYLGLELGTISLYALSAMEKDRPRSGEAGLKFLIMGAASSAVFLYGASLLYGSMGTIVFADMAPRHAVGPGLAVGLTMVLAAFSFKIAAVPFHMWAPDVYQGAPTPVTGFLSVASKAAGFAVLLRLLMGKFFGVQYDWYGLVIVLSGLSMVAGNLLAIPQTNIKRMLAYSGIAQAGYLLIALAASSERGIASAIFFLFQYLFTNLGAFTVVILVGSFLGNDEIRSYAGLSRRNPLVALCMLILLLSLGGIPPLSGFWGKLFVFWAAIGQELYGLVLIGVLATVVSLYYYLMVARQMYIEEPVDERPIPVSIPAALALAICTLFVIALGYPKPWMTLAEAAAKALGFLGA